MFQSGGRRNWKTGLDLALPKIPSRAKELLAPCNSPYEIAFMLTVWERGTPFAIVISRRRGATVERPQPASNDGKPGKLFQG